MKANKFAEILHVDPRMRPPLRSIDRKSSLFANICLFVDDENSVTISESQEYLVHVISGYLFEIFRVNLAFSVSVFAIL